MFFFESDETSNNDKGVTKELSFCYFSSPSIKNITKLSSKSTFCKLKLTINLFYLNFNNVFFKKNFKLKHKNIKIEYLK